ncbi:MAG TPA: RluA family pseudouridine synthase [Kiritimatiellia bacterium]|nr:RluA family pseudouridine synthase [Kiritimatiellia bacterium]HNS81833.1 RluA family pseudouridine synthase [Kiritimatiellia bacterium]HPA77207.1 RluA family pseudouridine synthase [Kiritimatiellia bacterium]HQQ04599.1 RluA family pseudouridine synthase [Kiritimatiellia bacterium]
MSRLTASPSDAGMRLDAWLARTLPGCSRSRWQQLIRDGHVKIGGSPCKPQHALAAGEEIEYEIPAAKPVTVEAEDIALDVLFEDRDIIVINKPAGLVVHPAPGNYTGTLVNALLHHCRDLEGIGGELRPGIVHRLDKDTSGVMVAAKNERAMQFLVNAFKNRQVHKEYLALVAGRMERISGTISTLIGRSRGDRKKMSVRPASGGREAVSHYRVEEQFAGAALLRITLETGRTHQIRVHVAHIGHPVIGDRKYGRAGNLLDARRQMLHAETLTLPHPVTREPMKFHAPVPEDMQSLLNRLRG